MCINNNLNALIVNIRKIKLILAILASISFIMLILFQGLRSTSIVM